MPISSPSRASSAPSSSSANSDFVHMNRFRLLDKDILLHPPALSAVDPRSIDAVLISSVRGLASLPLLTERSGYTGRIYATEPVKILGRQALMEIAQQMQYRSQRRKRPRNPEDSFDDSNIGPQQSIQEVSAHHMMATYFPDIVSEWIDPFTSEEVQKCIDKIIPLSYNQPADLFQSLRVMPTSSGHSLGTSNWVITDGFEKIAYVSSSSSSSSRHPQPLDYSSLRNCDALLMTDTCSITGFHYPPETALNDILRYIGSALSRSGNVLIPCHLSGGIILDLIEYIRTWLQSNAFGATPIYLIGPSAPFTLKYANIAAEWLSPARQERTYLPEAPFAHEEMEKAGVLRCFPSLTKECAQSLAARGREPSIVFTSHPSLRFGDSCHLMRWLCTNGNPASTVLLVDPDYEPNAVLAPFQPLNVTVHHCPIDVRFTASECWTLLKDLKPKNLIVSSDLSSRLQSLAQPQQQPQQKVESSSPMSMESISSSTSVKSETEILKKEKEIKKEKASRSSKSNGSGIGSSLLELGSEMLESSSGVSLPIKEEKKNIAPVLPAPLSVASSSSVEQSKASEIISRHLSMLEKTLNKADGREDIVSSSSSKLSPISTSELSPISSGSSSSSIPLPAIPPPVHVIHSVPLPIDATHSIQSWAYHHLDECDVPLDRQFTAAFISEDLARNIQPAYFESNADASASLAVASLHGYLVPTREGDIELHRADVSKSYPLSAQLPTSARGWVRAAPSSHGRPVAMLSRPLFPLGVIEAATVVKVLQEAGFEDAKVGIGKAMASIAFVIEVPSAKTVVRVSCDREVDIESSVVAKGDAIEDIVLRLLNVP